MTYKPDHYLRYLARGRRTTWQVSHLLKAEGIRERADDIVASGDAARALVVKLAAHAKGDGSMRLLDLLFDLHWEPQFGESWQSGAMHDALLSAAVHGPRTPVLPRGPVDAARELVGNVPLALRGGPHRKPPQGKGGCAIASTKRLLYIHTVNK